MCLVSNENCNFTLTNRCDTIIGTQINGHQIHIMIDIYIQFSPSGREEENLCVDHEFCQFWFRQSQVMVKQLRCILSKLLENHHKVHSSLKHCKI